MENIFLHEATDAAKVQMPIVLSCTVKPEVRTFSYKDLNGTIQKQMVHNHKLKAYYTNIHDVVETLWRNKDYITSFEITGGSLVTGIHIYKEK